MSIALRGELADFGISDVFQLVGQQCKTGCLEVRRREESAFVIFECGEVVGAFPGESTGELALGRRLVATGILSRDDAIRFLNQGRASARLFIDLVEEYGRVDPQALRDVSDWLTRDTLFEVLQWEEGRFDFSPEDVRSIRDCGESLSIERVLMDGMRQIDEWNAMRSEIPGEDEIFERRPGKDGAQPPESGPGAGHRERVWGFVDGCRSVRNVIECSRLDRFDAMCALVDLVRGGDIQPVSTEPGRSRPRRSMRVRAMDLSVGGPVVLLAMLVASLFLGASEPRNVEGADAFERAANPFETSERLSRDQARRFVLSGSRSLQPGPESDSLPNRDALATGGAHLYNRVVSEGKFLPESRR
ncbi:MAG: DUF4388 domain-containing protein [Myxococcota bacterium]|nr:DUF4388 domain-containing protein [Myxococcota bacterium]